MAKKFLGGIEAGGTKFICGVGIADSPNLIRFESIPTTSPAQTIARVIDFFQAVGEPLRAIGVGTFGPVQLDPNSPNFGQITTTPKAAWRNFDIRRSIANNLGVPVAIDTDINAAALGEARWGAANSVRTFLQVTVGTGVGGAAVIEGRLLNGLGHPEMGHIRVPHDILRDPFTGSCPYHGDCLEGLVSGPAVEARWGPPPVSLADDHPAWALQTEYLALACVNWICTLAPDKIIMAGGLMRPPLFPLVRDRVAALLNGYLDAPELADLSSYIVPSALEGRAGVLGAITLASRMADASGTSVGQN